MSGPGRDSQDGQRWALLLAAGMAMTAVIAVLTGFGLRPPEPLPKNAPAELFSAGRAAELLRRIYDGVGSHPVGSPENRVIRDRIQDHLSSLGYPVSIQQQVVCRPTRSVCTVVENLLVRVEGEPGRKAVLVSTHYDSSPAGPGVSDAGVSVAAVLEIARILKEDHSPKNPVLLLIGDGEEAGLLGARAFVESHPWAAEVGAVVNLEARGTSGRSWMFETSDQGGWLVEAYADSVPHPATASVAYAIYKRLPTDTDLTVYRAAGLHGLGFAFIGRVQHYHTPLDNLENLSEGTLQQQGANGLAMVRWLSAMDLEDPPLYEAVFFDLFGKLTVHWRGSTALVLGWLSLILCGAGAGRAVLAGRTSRSALGWGALSWLLTMVAGGAAGWLTLLLLEFLGVFASAYPAHSWLAQGAAWASGATAAFVVAGLMGRRAGPWGLAAGGAIGWGLLATVLTVIDPALSYLGVIPALLAGGCLLLLPRAGASGALCLLLPVVGGAVVWLQLILVLFGAMGQIVLPAISLLLALFLTLVVPPVAGLGSRLRFGWVAVFILALGLFAGAAAMVPAQTDELPSRMSLAYHLDAGSREGRWVVFGGGDDSRSLASAAGSEFTRNKGFPWWDRRDRVAEAAVLDLQPPVMTLTSPPTGEFGSYEVHLRSPRGAPTLDVVLPGGSRIHRVSYPGVGEATPGAGSVSSGGRWESWRFLAVPSVGITLSITPGGEEAKEGWIMDRTRGLPPEGSDLAAARPSNAVASQSGDMTSVFTTVLLPPPGP